MTQNLNRDVINLPFSIEEEDPRLIFNAKPADGEKFLKESIKAMAHTIAKIPIEFGNPHAHLPIEPAFLEKLCKIYWEPRGIEYIGSGSAGLDFHVVQTSKQFDMKSNKMPPRSKKQGVRWESSEASLAQKFSGSEALDAGILSRDINNCKDFILNFVKKFDKDKSVIFFTRLCDKNDKMEGMILNAFKIGSSKCDWNYNFGAKSIFMDDGSNKFNIRVYSSKKRLEMRILPDNCIHSLYCEV